MFLYRAQRGPGLVDQFCRARFQVVRSAQGIHHAADSSVLLQEQLGVPRNARGKVRGQGNGLIQGVGVQTLGAAQGGGQCFHRRASHVVERLLLREAPARRLAVGAKCLALGRGAAFLANNLGPKDSRGAHFGHFRPKIHPDGPKEGQSGRKFVHRHARCFPRPQVLPSVRQGERQFQRGRSSGLLHVVAGNGNAVELGHVGLGVRKNVRHNAHAGLRRIDVRIAHHELLQDVVLNGSLQGRRFYALLLCGHNVKGQYGQYGAVHGHGNGHFVQGNAVEQHLGIFHRIDGHAGFADVSLHAGMVGVVPAVGCQIKGYAQAFLAGS